MLRWIARRYRHLTLDEIAGGTGLPDFCDHWNFNVRGFNPGGNHGVFFGISCNLMGYQAEVSELPDRAIQEVIAPRVPQPTH